MSDEVKDTRIRPPIDLDEFERQLREIQSKPRSSSTDPLAELARIVGQDDPFRRQGLRSEPPLDTAEQASHADEAHQGMLRQIHDAPMELVQSPDSRAFDELLAVQSRPSLPLSGRNGFTSPIDELAAISSAESDETGPPPDFLQPRTHAAEAEAEADLHPYMHDTADKPSRAGMKIFIGLLVCGLAGVGAVWSLSGPKQSVQVASADVPVISAKPGPVKEKPSDPGGLVVPNQSAKVLEKARDDSKAAPKVLAREEQPVDLSQAAKKDVRRVDLGQAGPNGAAPVTIVPVPTVTLAAPSPSAPVKAEPVVAPPFIRQAEVPVKVEPAAPVAVVPTPPAIPSTAAPVAVPTPNPPTKPDSIVASADAASGPTPSVPKRVKSIRINSNGEPADAPTPPAASAATPAAAQRPIAPPKPVAVPKVAIAAPSTPKAPVKVAPVKEATTPSASEQAAASDAPLVLSPPAGVSRKTTQTPLARPKPVKVAAAPAPATDDTTSAIDPLTARPVDAPIKSDAGSRKFAVQFGAPGSTGEASTLIGSLKAKYPSVMGSVETRVIKAEVNGKSFYRVRSGAVSRDQANQICSQMKAAGGNCFISGA